MIQTFNNLQKFVSMLLGPQVQRERQQKQFIRRLRLAKQQLCSCIKLFCTFPIVVVARLRPKKMPDFTFCGGQEHKTDILFPFLIFNIYSPVEFNLRQIRQHFVNEED